MKPIFKNNLFYYSCIIILAILSCSINAEIYYVDAVKGNDSNHGTSEEKAWQSIRKVNTVKFKPGDQILFKRGQKWTDMLVPSGSGTKSSSITYGAYGTGDKPIITTRQVLPNSNKENKWKKVSANIYSLNLGQHETLIGRIWIDNTEYDRSDDPDSLDAKYRWYYIHKENTLYLYSLSNPAEAYKNIEFPGGTDNKYQTVKIVDKQYLILNDLDIQGGYTASISIAGSSYITIEECNIGKYSLGRGILGNQVSLKADIPTSDYITIKDNNIDSGWRIFAGYNRPVMDAISIQNGANYWEVMNNRFTDWDHSAVQIYGIDRPVSHNKVYMNIVTDPDIAFSRAFETVGTDSLMCRYNEFYRNRVSYTTARSQFGGTYNKIYYNVFEHMKNSTVPYGSHKTAQAIVFAAVAGPSEHNSAFNNTVYDTERDGIWDYGKNNLIVNNLILDSGKKNKSLSIMVSPHVEGSTWENNLIYVPEILENKPIVNYKTKSYTLHQFNAMNGIDEHKISGNILYTGKLNDIVIDAANGNYAPSANSPLIDAGIDMGIKTDFYGNPIVNKPDIGAIESGYQNLNYNSSK